jgi:hypothetical protein
MIEVKGGNKSSEIKQGMLKTKKNQKGNEIQTSENKMNSLLVYY